MEDGEAFVLELLSACCFAFFGFGICCGVVVAGFCFKDVDSLVNDAFGGGFFTIQHQIVDEFRQYQITEFRIG